MIAAHFGEPSLSVLETLFLVAFPFAAFAAAVYISRVWARMRRKP